MNTSVVRWKTARYNIGLSWNAEQILWMPDTSTAGRNIWVVVNVDDVSFIRNCQLLENIQDGNLRLICVWNVYLTVVLRNYITLNGHCVCYPMNCLDMVLVIIWTADWKETLMTFYKSKVTRMWILLYEWLK